MSPLSAADIATIVLFFVASLLVGGLWMTRSATRGLNDYFLVGLSMPWYLLDE